MKKIVGILSAAAVLAASVFAADISGKVKITGELFNWSEASKKTTMLTVTENNTANYAALFSLATNTEKAGANVDLWHNSGDLQASHWSLYFKPLDMLKITVGQFATALNQEHIQWYKLGGVSVDSQGFAASFAKDGFSADLFIGNGWNNSYFTKEDGKDAVVGTLLFKAGYAAGFGDISAAIKLDGAAGKDKEKIDFGAGYKNTFAPITFFVNVVGKVDNAQKDKFQSVVIEEDVSGSIDALSFEQFAKVSIPTYSNADFKTKGSVLVEAEVRYAMEKATPYLRITDDNLLAEKIKLNLNLGVRSSVGAMTYDAAIDITIEEKAAVIKVPVVFTVGL